jgi:hypothetical protein
MEYSLSSKTGSYAGKDYTTDEIKELVSGGYFKLDLALWEYIPANSHIRYLKKPGENNLPYGKRFKPGGFVRNHYSKDNKKFIFLETKIGGKRNDPGYISWPIAFDDIEIIWKKFPRDSFIEIYSINSSLLEKKTKINELEKKNSDLTKRIDDLETILKKSIK